METCKPIMNTYKIFITIWLNTAITRLLNKYDNIEIKYNCKNGDCVIIIYNFEYF